MTDGERTTWASVRDFLDDDAEVLDRHGLTWKLCWSIGHHDCLYRAEGESGYVHWTPDREDVIVLPTPPVPEPPDGSRIEFEYNTDVHAAWRDDAEGARAGYTVGDGGQNWVLYGESVPHSWAALWAMFGDALTTAVRLVPVAEDRSKREQWPTVVWAREAAANGE